MDILIYSPTAVQAMNELDLLRAMYNLHLVTVLLTAALFFFLAFATFLRWILPNFWHKKRGTVA